MEILYENSLIAVIIKPAGLPSENTAGENAVSLLKEQLNSELYPVHRLDTVTSGLMVYAKTKEAAAFLTKEITEDRMSKTYTALVHGEVFPDEDTLEDLLFKDSKKNKSFVVKRERKGVKKASLEYKVEERKNGLSLVKIKLHTGRTHQIRVQFSSRQHPVYGDGKYGSKVNLPFIALFSSGLSFTDPETKKPLSFERSPDWDFFN